MSQRELIIPRLVIGAQKGGAGKTFFTLGLLSALKERGWQVAAFKKGPDYIDAGWLSRAAGAPCRNLDPFLMDERALLSVFLKGVKGAQIAVVEGNRGLYDGVDLEGSCSTAQLARILRAPVILVLDCTKVTRTLAALLKGFLEFEDTEIKGVVLNRVARSRHENIITRSIEHYTGVPVLGAIPRLKVAFPERHLGLVPWQEYHTEEGLLQKLRASILENIDLEKIEEIAREAPSFPISQEELRLPRVLQGVRIGVLWDRAFQFYYPENLEALEGLGAELLFMDALSASGLPPLEALYIGGGFPETQAEALAENLSFRREIKAAAQEGLPIYAECGGLMYLGERILWKAKAYPMCGVLPLDFEVKERPQGHGYTVVRVIEDNPYYPKGHVIQGHEFHYSLPRVRGEKELRFCFKVERGFGFDGQRDGVLYKNTFGTYTHVHAASTQSWVRGMVQAISRYLKRDFSSPWQERSFDTQQNSKEGGWYVRDHH